ncbi:MAG: hypothetical protein GY950_08750 [bacterium]|nr:hypothetical protein [bacterium]
MKSGYLLIFVFAVCIGIGAGDGSLIKVKATGLAPYGIPPGPRARAAALRAAKVEGYKKLAEAAGFSYKHTKVEAFLKGARVTHKRYISDYKVEVVMEIEKKNISHTKMSLLKKEIKTIEARIVSLNRRLEKLKKMMEVLKKK